MGRRAATHTIRRRSAARPVSFIDRDGRVVLVTAGVEALSFSGSLFGGLRLAYIDRDGAIVWRER